MPLSSALAWYQGKIGAYDKQLWEITIEQQILKGLSHIPKKSTRLKTELIDVDLVRGSAFPKAKPQHGPLVATRRGLVRILLLPLYFTWWKQQTTTSVAIILLVIYFLQLAATVIYFCHAAGISDHSDITLIEVVIPCLLLLLLGVIHSQVVSTANTKAGSCRNKAKRKRIKGWSAVKSSTVCFKSGGPSAHPYLNFSGLNSEDAAQEFSKVADSCETSEGKPNIDVVVNESLQDTDDTASLGSDSNQNIIEHLDNTDKFDNDTKNDSAVQDVSSGDVETDPVPSDLEDKISPIQNECSEDGKKVTYRRRMFRRSHDAKRDECNCNSSCESEIDTTAPNTPVKVSDGDWGMTTNSECDNSYSSNLETEDEDGNNEDPFSWDLHGSTGGTFTPSTCPTSHKVSCTMWEGTDVHKVDLSVLDISSAIIRRVDSIAVGSDYLIIGFGFAVILALLPNLMRLRNILANGDDEILLPNELLISIQNLFVNMQINYLLSSHFMILATTFNSVCLSMLFFFLLAVAERTFKQRFLSAKLFSHLTSSRRARKSELPHFRLHKVRNIKTWLSVRSYLKRHGPQRSVDVIVSAAFILAFLLVCLLCFQLMKDTENFGHCLLHWEVLVWTMALGVFLLRLMTLGARINKKYRNPSVLITEQINLYLQMEQKPHKKEGLVLANNVLKLAADLLKELESPFKISGLSANPYLYNITKLVILSAFSAVVKEILGFKLKLYKIKIK